MSADTERLLPPNEPAAFESLCLDLWKNIWGDLGAQKNGRIGSFLYAFLSIGAGLAVTGDLEAYAGLGRSPTGLWTIAQLGIAWFLFVWFPWVGATTAIRQSLQISQKQRK